ncbi:MAG: septum formation initiator family protein [Spirochaetales bacterium]|nr:septum formation initiator family protein [Spirochaetales bacterium]
MKAPYRLYATLNLLLGGLIYIVVFGNSGYIVHLRLKTQVSEIKQKIEDLKEENKHLSERYHLLSDDSRALAMTASQYYFLSPGATIIRIEDEPPPEKTAASGGPFLEHRLSLLEWRAFFLVGWVFLSLLGLALLNYVFADTADDLNLEELTGGSVETG